MNGWTAAVLTTWVAALWGIGSITFSEPSKFRNLGKSKGKWFLIEVLGFIPYFGLIVTLTYVVKVRIHFPPKPPRPVRPSNSRSTRPSQTGSGSGSSVGSTSPRPVSYEPLPRQRCGGGCNNGRVPCYGCQSGWVTDYSGATVSHPACGGRGSMTCQMCGGTGFRN
jgi:hypothetical protein